jgi:protein OS-9
MHSHNYVSFTPTFAVKSRLNLKPLHRCHLEFDARSRATLKQLFYRATFNYIDNMRRLNLVLLATIGLCRARHSGFSVHDDLVAYPQVKLLPAPSTSPKLICSLQYEVVFSENPLSEQEAQALLDSANTQSAFSPAFSSHAEITDSIRAGTAAEALADSDDLKVSETYEYMSLYPSKYLCSIPILKAPAPENQTATELAKAEEARELTRASAHGWELLNGLDGGCLYFMSGWWSYSFCYNREVVQFHALPTVSNNAAPIRDLHTAEYVLGRVPSSPSGERQPPQRRQQEAGDVKPPNTELQIKGDQRYLVQRLDGGTVCDLTGRERTIEVQYHCVPGLKGDRIGWIKEVTTCAYLMVVNTARLCDDVAFLPPKETSANPITCRLVLHSEDPAMRAEWNLRKTLDTRKATGQAQGGQQTEGNGQSADGPQCQDPKARQPPVYTGINVGGIVVGGHNFLEADGKSPPKLSIPRSYLPGRAGRVVEVIASARSKAEGSKVEIMSREELEKRDLNPDLVDEMKQELQKLAGDHGWKLEIVEVPGDPREIRGMIDEPGDEDKDKESKGSDEGSEEKFFTEDL